MTNKYWGYKITSPSEKVYIGITNNIINRMNNYRTLTSVNPIIKNSIIKHGFSNHTVEILYMFVSKEEAIQKEIEWIAFYKNLGISMNISDGGYLGHGLSEDENPLCRAILQFDLEGNFIKEWVSATRIQLELDISQSALSNICRSKEKYYLRGFLWCFKEDYEKGIKKPFNNSKPLGLGARVAIYQICPNGDIICYSSMLKATSLYEIKAPKKKIYQALYHQKPDENGNYWKRKKDLTDEQLSRIIKTL